MASAKDDTKNHAKDFEAVRARELAYILRRRQKGDALPKEEEVADSLIGLSFSGGGIRSATTNLGIAQALSRMGILRLVDYLSTVSGGGYIGGCLSSLLSVNVSHKELAGQSAQFDFTSRDELQFGTNWPKFPFNPERRVPETGRSARRALGVGNKLVAHLRTHGDFLIARRSILKREALRAVGTLVGGLLYTVLLMVLSLSVVSLLLLGAAHVLSRDVSNWKNTSVESSLADSELQYTRAGALTPAGAVREAADPDLWAHLKSRLALIWNGMTQDIRAQETGAAFGVGCVVTVLVLLIFLGAMKWWKGPETWAAGESREDGFEVRLLRLAAALLALGVLIVPIVNAQLVANRTSPSWLLQPFFVVAGAYVTALIAYALVLALFGTAGFLWSRGSRSLWGSYLAITLYGTVVALLFAVLPAASYAAHAVGVTGVLAPIGSLLAGRLLMTRSVTGAAERFEVSKTILHILLGIVVAALIGFTMIEVGALAIDKGFVDPTAGPAFLIGLAVSGGALALLCGIVNLNRIGLHYFYRDRILETYLRSEVAMDDGRMEPFVDTMEMRLKDLHGNQPDNGRPGNSAPYLLVSAALNLAGSRDLTRKDRKSGYFIFSKYFCGSQQTGYRETDQYQDGRTQLARALTVSGAAAGTGMGYQTFFAQSFLTALFNIRLGQWISNPRTNSGERGVFWPYYILLEALGLTNECTNLVNVSDGGHTGDNVGIYPLFERRCQVIIACDAEADASIAFGSFTEALRHAYIDLGVDVDIDLSMIMPDPATGLSKAHCAIGRIRYPECPGRPNWLIYMKNSLTGNEPAPILNYKRTSADFPHETTADQFFDDAQFESYRALGDHIAEETLARWILDSDVRAALHLPVQRPPTRPCVIEFPLSNPALAWDDLLIHHSPFRAANNEEFQELARLLSDLEQLVIETPSLRWYYLECMGLPPDEKVPANQEHGDPVNVIAMQIQLMEDAYFSLRLDQYANARDNRGWMNLFRRWGHSPTFRKYFKALQTVYSNDFVAFYCNYIEDWKVIDEEPLPHAWDVLYGSDGSFDHPVARKCRERGAPGLFLDAGRREAREPDEERPAVRPMESPLAGQHGDTGLTTETRPPTSESSQS